MGAVAQLLYVVHTGTAAQPMAWMRMPSVQLGAGGRSPGRYAAGTAEISASAGHCTQPAAAVPCTLRPWVQHQRIAEANRRTSTLGKQGRRMRARHQRRIAPPGCGMTVHGEACYGDGGSSSTGHTLAPHWTPGHAWCTGHQAALGVLPPPPPPPPPRPPQASNAAAPRHPVDMQQQLINPAPVVHERKATRRRPVRGWRSRVRFSECRAATPISSPPAPPCSAHRRGMARAAASP